jgi:hypothetical protein
MKTFRIIILLALLLLAAGNHSAWACDACYGDTSGSKMGSAAAVGIGAMVVLMFFMLGAIFAAGWRLAWRAKHPLPDYNELLREDPPPDNHDPKP